MSLSFLAPAALGLAALVALPILAHLSRQVPRERRAFGAMLLLERVIKRLRRRRRLKDPWLLLLRVLAILAVVFAVAGPRWSYVGDGPEFGGSGRVVVVLDRSLSMGLVEGGGSLLQRARTEAVELIEALSDEALVGGVVYGAEVQRLTPSLTQDHGLVASRLEEVQPGYGPADLRGALLEARRLLGGEPGEVVVFTDEAGPGVIGQAEQEIERLLDAEGVLIPRPVHADPPRNVAVVSARYGDGIEGGQVTFRVANFGPDAREVPCEVTLPDGAVIPVFVDVPPEGEAEGRVTVPREAEGGVGRAWCEDPDLPADATRYFHLPRVGASRVLVVDGSPGDTPTRSEVYFLERALAPWGPARSGVRPEVITPVGLTSLDADEHRVVFMANVADPRAYGPRLTEFVRRGGSLVISAGNQVTAERYNASLGGILPAQLRRPMSLADPSEEGVALALPNTDHALFEPFARGGRGGFRRVRTHRILALEPFHDNDEVQTLLSFENGAPALVERQVGAGRVLLWTSSIDFAWTNLPLQAVFLPLIQRMVGWLGGEAGGGEARLQARVGEMVSLPLPDLAMEPEVHGPDGQVFRSRIEDGELLFTPNRPGAWEVVVEGAPPLARVAANVAPEASDVRRYGSLSAAGASIRPELFTRHVELGPGLLGAGLLFLLWQAAAALRREP